MNSDIANNSDIKALTSLLGLLFSQEAEFSADPQRQAAGLQQIIDNPQTGEILLLREHGQAIAMVNLLYTVSTALGGRVAILEDMVVHPDYRNHGIGSTLIRDAIQHAQDRGCLRITLLTDGDNIDAQRFYQRHHFLPSTMHAYRLSLPLEENPL